MHTKTSVSIAEGLIKAIDICEKDLKQYKCTLEAIQCVCKHEWTKPKYQKVAMPYYINGCVSSDPKFSYPGIAQYQEVDSWHRQCVQCLKREQTTTCQVHSGYPLKEPIFDDSKTPTTQHLES